MKAVIVGIGNTIVRDDGVGIYVSRILRNSLHHPNVEIKETYLSGMTYIDMLEGFDYAFIIDSIKLDDDTVGKVYKIEEKIESTNPKSLHQFNIYNAVSLGKKMGLKIPDKIIIYAVNVLDNSTFGESLSSKIKRVLPLISDDIKKDIQKYLL